MTEGSVSSYTSATLGLMVTVLTKSTSVKSVSFTNMMLPCSLLMVKLFTCWSCLRVILERDIIEGVMM